MMRFLDDSFRSKLSFNDEDVSTMSSEEQKGVERTVAMCFEYLKSRIETDPETTPELHRDRHEAYLKKGIEHISISYECLDASRCWLVYWILHAFELLEMTIPDELSDNVIDFLGRCQCENGGFGGGPGQMAHLASTYPAVNALCILGTDKAYQTINRETLKSFLLRMHTADGGFIMHDGGEEDIRGAYCAASVAKLTNVMTREMFDKTPEWIISCQTYEGGFGGCPYMEAHGGYSFCGLAALLILGHEKLCDLQALMRWMANKQMKFEGGFQGRTNKLVDGCYSFWQGGAFPLLHMALLEQGDGENSVSPDRWMFDQDALQEYILGCCQYPAGGLIDKPTKRPDFYHTMYCLSGLSVAQHFMGGHIHTERVLGPPQNQLLPTHPVFNIGMDRVIQANQYFSGEP